ncbi:MAG: tetraacyldisaccharide 4'-kinase [Desulfobacterales bacterium]|nr:tetraacyldisaccharide 4'-kinase [Desulfobacterales bacterium]
MRADHRHSNPDALSRLLYAASRIYGGAVSLRNSGFDKGLLSVRRLPCPVISIGNITAGGTGKTPMALYMARLMRQMGYRPAVISRGYRGKAEKAGAVVTDGHHLFADCATAGDEPFMMASVLKGVPVLVGRNRFQSGMRAVAAFDSDVIVLDDAFQHRRLHRDLDLVLLDAAHPLGNRHVLPRGSLREPVSGLKRADAVILTRSPSREAGESLPREISGHVPVFCADHVPFLSGIYGQSDCLGKEFSGREGSEQLSFLGAARVFAFSGIARNQEFLNTLSGYVGSLAGFSPYPDHYCYSTRDLEQIEQKAISASADCLITTEKDYVRIAGRLPAGLPLVVMGVEMRFLNNDESGFVALLRRKLLETKLETRS